MKLYRYQLEPEAQEDLERLYQFMVDVAPEVADKALEHIYANFRILEITPHSCRKAASVDGKVLRELIIKFGRSGYVALFEVSSEELVSILAIKHQRESDYH